MSPSVRKNSTRLNLTFSYIQIIVQILYSFAIVPIRIHYWGEALYGTYVLAASLAGYLSLSGGFMGIATIRYTAHYRATGQKEKERQLMTLSAAISAVTAVIALSVGIFLCFHAYSIFHIEPEHLDEARSLLLALVLQSAVTVLFSPFQAVIQGYERYDIYKLATAASFILKFLSMLAMLVFGAVAVVWAETLVQAALMAFYGCWSFLRLGIRLGFARIDKKFILELCKYSIAANAGSLVDVLFWKTPPLILGILCTTVSVTHFNVSSCIAIAYMSISYSFAEVFLPKFTKLSASGAAEEEINGLFMRFSRYQFMLTGFVFCAFIVLGRSFINVWLGTGYDDSYLCTLIIMASLLVPLSQNIGVQVLYAQKKHMPRSIIYLGTAAFNIALGLLLVRFAGVFGAAASVAVSFLLGPVLSMNLYYRKALGLNVFKFWGFVAGRTSVALLISGTAAFFIRSVLPMEGIASLAAGSVTLIIIYVPLLYLFSVTANEKAMLKTILKRR